MALLLISTPSSAGPDVMRSLALTNPLGEWVEGRRIWLSEAMLPAASPVLARHLHERVILSAALLHELPGGNKRWIAVEWWGRLVVAHGLEDLVPAQEWVETASHPLFTVFEPVLQPRDARDVETMGEFRERLSGDPTRVRVRLEAVLADLPGWFGDFADDRVGGAYALLVMSGARSRGSETITLRNPSALGMSIDSGAETLAAHVRAGRVGVRAKGFNTGANYAIRAQLTAGVEPQVLIQRGAVFEQMGVVDVQTLAVKTPVTVSVDISTFEPVILPAWCLDSSLSAPGGEPVRPTPLVFDGLSDTTTQHEVWGMRERAAR